MADPVTAMAAIGMAAGVAGGGMSALGAYSQGRAGATEANYRAGIAAFNQRIARQNADYERKTGEVNAEIAGIRNRQVVGAITTGQAASGLDVNKGTAVKVRESQLEAGAFDQATIRANAARRAFGYEVQAAGLGAEQQLDYFAAHEDRIAANYGIASSILGTAASTSSKFMQAKSAGAFA